MTRSRRSRLHRRIRQILHDHRLVLAAIGPRERERGAHSAFVAA